MINERFQNGDDLAELRKCISKIPKKKEGFFDLISCREVFVSQWLAYLFDETKCGCGRECVKALLRSVLVNHKIDDYVFEEVKTEVATFDDKRIDILIKFDKLWIVIENKIYSGEHDNQTQIYYDYIEGKREGKEVVYIYLKPIKEEPSCKHFVNLTYQKLIAELKNITNLDFVEKEKYKYLKEFIESGERFVENYEVTERDQLYFNNYKMIDELVKDYNDKNERLKKNIADEIEKLLEKKYPKDKFKTNHKSTYIQIFKEGWKNKKDDGVHFEIQFLDPKHLVLNPKVDFKVVLHVEKMIDDKQREKLAKVGVVHNTEFKEVRFDFSDCALAKDLVEIVAKGLYEKGLKHFIDEYAEKIDKVLRS